MQGNGKSEKGKGKRRRSGRSCQPMEVVGKKVLAERLLPTSEVKIGDPAYCLKADRMRRKVDNVEFDCLFISRLSTYPCFSFFSSYFLLLCYPTVYTSSHSSILHSILYAVVCIPFIVRGVVTKQATHATRTIGTEWRWWSIRASVSRIFISGQEYEFRTCVSYFFSIAACV